MFQTLSSRLSSKRINARCYNNTTINKCTLYYVQSCRDAQLIKRSVNFSRRTRIYRGIRFIPHCIFSNKLKFDCFRFNVTRPRLYFFFFFFIPSRCVCLLFIFLRFRVICINIIFCIISIV